jgi:hypothetical protein
MPPGYRRPRPRQGGIVGVYDRHDYLAEKRDALDVLAAEIARITADAPTDSNAPLGASPKIEKAWTEDAIKARRLLCDL